jgi:3-methyladenine DNA glycosylase AlkD
MNIVSILEKRIQPLANSEIAHAQSKYLKNQFVFLGIKKPVLFDIQKAINKEYRITTAAQLAETIQSLWCKKEREYHYSACLIAQHYHRLWTPAMLDLFEQMIRTHSWWDTVDTIAVHLVGKLLTIYPDLKKHMNIWSVDENMWVRRAALLFQLRYKHSTDYELLFLYCTKMMHEKEFFIRKAIGWVLREYSKTDRHKVALFLDTYAERLSGLSKREAQKYLL